jgi:hypothetical protein
MNGTGQKMLSRIYSFKKGAEYLAFPNTFGGGKLKPYCLKLASVTLMSQKRWSCNMIIML